MFKNKQNNIMLFVLGLLIVIPFLFSIASCSTGKFVADEIRHGDS